MHLERRLADHAAGGDVEHNVLDALDELRDLLQFLAEDGEDVADAGQDHQTVVEPDDAVVARVGRDLTLLLEVEPGRGHRAACAAAEERGGGVEAGGMA